MKCRLCKETLDTEHPNSVYGHNPETFRKGWMHFYCYQNAKDELKNEKSSNIQYQSKHDEYCTRFA